MSILIKKALVATVEPSRIIEDGAVYIEDDRIMRVGETEEVSRYGNAEHVIDATGKLVVPGFINAHTHCEGPTLLKGNSVELKGYRDFIDYLQNCKWPALMSMSSEDHRLGALLGYLENIKSGTTLVANNYYAPKGEDTEGIAEAAAEIGIRSVLVRGYHDTPYLIPDVFIETLADLLKTYSKLHSKWHNKADGRIKAWIGPVNLLYNSPESIKGLVRLSTSLGIGLHSHVSEVKRGCEVIVERHGKSYVEVLFELGALGPKFQAAHSVWLSDRDIELLAQTQTTVVHNPASNMALTDGIAPVSRMRKAGVRVALGTDGMLGMIDAMRLAVYLQKVSTLDPWSLTANEALEMATIEGARAYGLGDQIGSIKVGKKADMNIVDLKSPQVVPCTDPITALVYYAEGSNVETVIIDGKIVMKDRVVTTIREDEVLARAQNAAHNILGRTFGRREF